MGSTSRRRKAVFIPGSKWLFLNNTGTVNGISEPRLARLAQQKRLQSPMWLCVLYRQMCSSAIPWILLQVSERVVQLIRRWVVLKSRLQASQNKQWCYLASWWFSKSRRCPRTLSICSWCLPETLARSLWMSGEQGRGGGRPWRGNSWGDTNENSIKQKTWKIQTSTDALLRAADEPWFQHEM